MKKLITANDIRAAHARGEQAMSVVLRASIITPEAREVAELLDSLSPKTMAPRRRRQRRTATKRKASGSGKPSWRSYRKASLPKAWWRS